MKIKYNSDDKLPLYKTIEVPDMTIVVRAIFYENNKCYPQVFLNYRHERVKLSHATKKTEIYSAKQKHLLPFYITHNKLKKFCINNIL